MVLTACSDADPPGRHLDERLRRKMLLINLGLLSAVYALAVVQALVLDSPRSDARGEIVAVALTVAGLLVSLRAPLAGWRYVAALFCISAAPILSVLFHELIAAQIWSVVPLMFVAIFIRTWHSATTARIVVAGIAAAAVIALLVAPAPIPVVWLAFYAVSVLGAAEVFGLGNAALLDAAFRDPLTLVWNRAGVSRRVGRLVRQARRRSQEIAVLVFDVDDFKRVNDQRGHAAGDRLLTDLAGRWVAEIPRSSVMGRIGGDEFVLIVGGFDETQARALADQLTSGLPVPVTYGVAAGPPGHRALDTLFAAADRDLYERKRLRKA
ncbi:diguanylate cyclase domain-containing protein [Mycobacterium sp. TJFP1]